MEGSNFVDLALDWSITIRDCRRMTATMPAPILDDWITIDTSLADAWSICHRLALEEVPAAGSAAADELAIVAAVVAPRLGLTAESVAHDPPIAHLRLVAEAARRPLSPSRDLTKR